MEGSKKHYVDNTAQFSSAGLIIRQKEPKNLEAPFDRIDSYLTPTELFYIRSHFPTPNLDRASYQLRIDGAVRRPFTLSYEELRSMRSETRVATLECARRRQARCLAHSREQPTGQPYRCGVARLDGR
jgi:hypothetical protein